MGPVTFQPVELAKLMLVIFFASYFVEKREMLSLSTRRVGNRLLPDLRPLGPIAVAWVVSLLVILFEHDIGFSLLLFVMFIATLWVATGRWTYVVGGLIAFVAGTFLAAHLPFAKTLIDQRMTAWINPGAYANTIGYQPIQAWDALARGGLTGTGLGLGTPYFIPVAYSDFIFAAIGEELGLLGTTAVVVGFLLLIGAGMRAALRAPLGVLEAGRGRVHHDSRFSVVLHHGGRAAPAPADRRVPPVHRLRGLFARGELRPRGPADAHLGRRCHAGGRGRRGELPVGPIAPAHSRHRRPGRSSERAAGRPHRR